MHLWFTKAQRFFYWSFGLITLIIYDKEGPHLYQKEFLILECPFDNKMPVKGYHSSEQYNQNQTLNHY